MPTRNKFRSKKHIKTKKQKRSKKYIAKKKKYLRKTRKVFRGGAAMPAFGRDPLSDPFGSFAEVDPLVFTAFFTAEYPTMDARFDFLYGLKKPEVTDQIHNCICNILFYLANVEKFAIVNGNPGQDQGIASLDRKMFQKNNANQIALNAAHILKTSTFIDNITQQQNVSPYRPAKTDKDTQYFVLGTVGPADERIVWKTTQHKPKYDAAHIIQIKFISVFLNYLKILIPDAKDCLEWLDTRASVIYTETTVNQQHEMFLRSGSIVFWMIMYVLIYNLGNDCIVRICGYLTPDSFQKIMASTAILDAYTKKLLGQIEQEQATGVVIHPNLIEFVMIEPDLNSIHDTQAFMSGARGNVGVMRKASADILALSLLFEYEELPNIFSHTLELWGVCEGNSDLNTMFVLTGRDEPFNKTLVESHTGYANSPLYYRKRALDTFIGLVESPRVDKVSREAADRIGLVNQLSHELYVDPTKSFEDILVASENPLVSKFMEKYRRAQMPPRPGSPRPNGPSVLLQHRPFAFDQHRHLQPSESVPKLKALQTKINAAAEHDQRMKQRMPAPPPRQKPLVSMPLPAEGPVEMENAEDRAEELAEIIAEQQRQYLVVAAAAAEREAERRRQAQLLEEQRQSEAEQHKQELWHMFGQPKPAAAAQPAAPPPPPVAGGKGGGGKGGKGGKEERTRRAPKPYQYRPK